MAGGEDVIMRTTEAETEMTLNAFDKNKTNMVKCIAIILMLMHHLFGCATAFCSQYGVESGILPWDGIYRFSLMAKVCVGMFVFLTAYGITRAYNLRFGELEDISKKEMEKFCINRYIKLALNFVLIYILALATSFLRAGGAQGVYGVNGWKKGIIYGVCDMLGISYYFSFPSLNETWWYMSLAIFLIFIVPMLIRLYKSFGRGLVIVGILLYFLGVSDNDFIRCMLCVIMGICCAEENVLERIHNVKVCRWEIINGLIKLVCWAAVFAVLIKIRGEMSLNYWIDPIVAIVCCEFCMELSKICPIAEKLMGFVGSHSMNIFLVHTLLFEYYFTDFIYGFKNWILILLALLIMSLLTSVVIEWLKKVLGYNKLIKKVLR